MRLNKESVDETLDRLLARFDSPSSARVQSAIDRVGKRLQSRIDDSVSAASSIGDSNPSRRLPRLSLAAAAAFLLAIGISVAGIYLWSSRDNGGYATVESVDGSLYNNSLALKIGDRISMSEIVHTSDGARAQLTLADGSSVEMRSKSELLFERANDGVRIRLREGGIIVNAAKQRTGHLYVQTKDVNVSVVGTVFMVNSEEPGSRVGVIEGEVRVEQEGTRRILMPGEQVMTKPQMEWQPMSEQITWSRHAEEHVALLQQTTAASSQGKPRPSFEVASVKPIDPSSMLRHHEGHLLTRERFLDRTELLQFIVRAYLGGGPCLMTATPTMGQTCPLITGSLPSWVRTDMFEIQATMPPNSVPSYTSRQLHAQDTPEFNLMLKSLLEERFHLKAHWEMKEIPVYALSVRKDGAKLKQKPPESQPRKTPDGFEIHGLYSINTVPTPDDTPRMQMEFLGSSMKQAAETFAIYFDRPLLDRTGLQGEYDFKIEYDVDASTRIPLNPFSGLTPSGLSAALQAVGLTLESTKAPVEILVIDHVQKPSEN
jgi:uncharacterized protein (TIGR03435 family)